MAIARRHIGYSLPTFTVCVEPQRLSQFTQAIGEPASAPSALVPPTFMKMLEGEQQSSRRILDALEVDLRRVLHAEQQFDYLAPVCAGDQLEITRTVTDIHEKRNGALEFIVIESELTRAGTPVGRSRQVVLVRHSTAGGSE